MNGASTVLTGVFAGRYSIERELGRGGSAIVYLARDQLRGQAVAIKVLRPELAESVGADRFLREIRLTESLQHPHILSVLDTGMHENRPYFVLPYMEGGTLRHRLEREKQLALDEVLSITRAVAESLAHAHAKGFIHRDVKPENILFTAGQACLGDFGIARALERSIDDATTSTSLVRGTPLYMSPEQATGQRALDARTDVYSLASVVYELLAGVPPFVGPTPESVLAQKATRSPPPVRNYRPTVPLAVDGAIARGLMLTPADRYKDPLELVAALERGARTPDLDSGATTWSTKRRAIFGGIASLMGIAGAVVAFQLLKPETDGTRELDPRRLAVLYFDDLSPDHRLGHIAAGLTENLIDQLSQVPQLRVISPNGVRRFRNSDAPFDSMAKALDAGTFIAGSVSRAGAQLRVSVRMIDAATGAQVNSRTLQKPSWDFFRLQDSISLDVSYWLRERLGAQVRLRDRRAASSVASWELLHSAELLARDAGDRVIAGDSTGALVFRRADSLLTVAEAQDPKWVEPTVSRAQVAIARAFVYVDRSGRPTERFGQELRSAIVHANRALASDPNSADALIARAEARDRLVAWFGAQPAESLKAESESDLRRAVALRPDRARAWYALGAVRFAQARFDEAVDALKTAYDADPFLENVRLVLNLVTMSSLYANRIDEARRWCDLSISRFPDDPRFRECALYVLGFAGNTPAAVTSAWRLIEDIERADTLDLHVATWSYRRAMVAVILARSGLRDSARAVLERTRRDRGRRLPAEKPEAYARLLIGDRDEALALLRQVLAASPTEHTWISKMSWFQPLHGDQRFREMIGLP